MENGDLQLAIFKGEQIGADDLILKLQSNSDVAIAITKKKNGSIIGSYKAFKPNILKISGLKDGRLYKDGFEIKLKVVNGIAEFLLDKGEHSLEFTTEKPIPLETKIIDTEYERNRIKIEMKSYSQAESIRIDVSYDGGKTWKEKAKTNQMIFYLPKEKVERLHIRAVSMNGNKEANFAQEYPVYFTDIAPHYPDGIWLKLSKDLVQLTWGEVLGIQKYKLYRRKQTEKNFELIYEGKARCFTDKTVSGVIQPFDSPGILDNKTTNRDAIVIYEYAVSSINGNGEGLLSPVVNTDPASWKNWYPKTELIFNRQSAFWMPPYVYTEMSPEKNYPY